MKNSSEAIREAFTILRIFRDYKKGITIDGISELLEVTKRTAFRKLVALRNAGIEINKRKLGDNTFYYIKAISNYHHSDVFDLLEPINSPSHKSVTEKAQDFKVLKNIWVIEKISTGDITAFTNTASVISYHPDLTKDLLYNRSRHRKKITTQDYKINLIPVLHGVFNIIEKNKPWH